jgi:hypothetical protein
MPPEARRGPSSLLELAMSWEHPVYVAPVVADDGRTSAGKSRKALPLAQALAFIAKADPRPLLVLRDCFRCSGTDDALMTRNADNEKTMLMSRWFHCVRLPPDVLQPNHPFVGLFPGERPAHLFVAQPDGSGRIDLMGDQSRTELWGAMEAVLAKSYTRPPQKQLKELARLLDKLDSIDERIAKAQAALDDLVESDGPGSRKFKKLHAELTKMRSERNELRNEAVLVSRLDLRKAEGPASAAPGAARGS